MEFAKKKWNLPKKMEFVLDFGFLAAAGPRPKAAPSQYKLLLLLRTHTPYYLVVPMKNFDSYVESSYIIYYLRVRFIPHSFLHSILLHFFLCCLLASFLLYFTNPRRRTAVVVFLGFDSESYSHSPSSSPSPSLHSSFA